MKYLKSGSLLFMALLTACTLNEPKLPAWDTQWSLQLPADDFNMSEVVDDSTLIADTTQSGIPIISFTTSDTSEWQRIDKTDLALDELSESYSITVGTIELTDAEELQTDTVNVMDALPAAILAAGDTLPPYSAFTTESEASEEYTHYESVHIVSGNIWLTFHNEMFLNIDAGMSIKIYNNDGSGTQIGEILFSTPIPSGTSVNSELLNLADKTISNKIRLVYSIPIAGATEPTILTDEMKQGFYYSDMFMDKLIVDEARAIVPDQEFVYSDSLALPESDIQLRRAVVDKGGLVIRLNNNIAINAQVQITMPDLVKDGNPKVINTLLSPGRQTVENVPLAGWELMNSAAPSSVIDNIRIEVASMIGSDGAIVPISASDSVTAEIEADSLYFSSFEGDISNLNFAIEPTESETIDFPSELEQGIRLPDLEMHMLFENEIDFPIDLDLHIVGYRIENEQITDSVHIVLNEVIQKNSVSPQTDIVLNGSSTSPSIVDLLALLPTKIKFYGQATIDGSGSIAANQGMRVKYTISSPLTIHIPSAISYSVDPDTLTEEELDKDTRDMLTNDIREASAELTLTNGLPVGAELTLYLVLDPADFDSDTIADSSRKIVLRAAVEAGETDASGYVSQAVASTVNFHLSETQLQIFAQPPVFMKQEVVIPPTEGTVRFRQTDKVAVDAWVNVKYRINEE